MWAKVAEERAELEAAYAAAPKTPDGKMLSPERADDAEIPDDPRVAAAEMEFGDVLFTLVNVARKMGIDAESALRAACGKFRRRWAQVEEAAWQQGANIEDMGLDQLEALWQDAKKGE